MPWDDDFNVGEKTSREQGSIWGLRIKESSQSNTDNDLNDPWKNKHRDEERGLLADFVNRCFSQKPFMLENNII
jgi:hypothetical protein